MHMSDRKYRNIFKTDCVVGLKNPYFRETSYHFCSMDTHSVVDKDQELITMIMTATMDKFLYN